MIRRGAHNGAPGTGGYREQEGPPSPAAGEPPCAEATGGTGEPGEARQAVLGGAACRIPVFATYATVAD